MYPTFKYVYPSLLDKQKAVAEKSYFTDKSLSYKVYDNACVLPVIFNDRKYWIGRGG